MLAVLREEARSAEHPPGVYFRMLLIGYFERAAGGVPHCLCASFLALEWKSERRTISLSRIRNRLPLEVHESVLEILASRGMIDGKTLGVDATTLRMRRARPRDAACRHAIPPRDQTGVRDEKEWLSAWRRRRGLHTDGTLEAGT